MEHWHEGYKLFYGGSLVGRTAGEGGVCGFPTFWVGAIEYDSNLWSSDETQHLANYLKIVLQAAERLAECKDTSELNARINADFMDVVDSSEWRLVDSKGEVIPIYCPMHHQNGGISWVRVDGKVWC